MTSCSRSSGCSRDHAQNGTLQEFPSIRGLLLSLAALLTLSAVIGLFAALSYKETKRVIPGNERITLDHIFNDTFAVQRTALSWVPEGVTKVGYPCDCGADRIKSQPPSLPFTQAGDGVFSVEHDGFIKLVNLKSNATTNLVRISDLIDVSLVNGFARVALDHVHIVGARKSAGHVQLEAVA